MSKNLIRVIHSIISGDALIETVLNYYSIRLVRKLQSQAVQSFEAKL